MRLGVHLVRFDVEGGGPALGSTIAAFGHAAEEAGLDNVSVMDHYWQMAYVGGPELNMLEAYTTLGFLAASTVSVELQALVTGVSYRHPGLLAKIVTTLDVLSGGRAMLGLGAAWYEEEHRGLGVPYPPRSERFDRLEETLRICRQMFDGVDAPYDGRHYKLDRTLNLPAPVGPIPIMVGGQGERRTLRLVARYADACNLFANPGDGLQTVRHKLDVLRRHCEEAGTDYARIRKTILWSVGFDPATQADAFLDAMRAYADLGITEVHVVPPGNEPVRYVEALGRHVVPHLRTV